VICRPYGNIKYSLPMKEIDDPSFSYSRDMFSALKFKVDHMT